MAFQCELMDDPVVAADGHTYNRFDIENWFKEHDTSPLTNEPLEHKILTPNIMARKLINAWREQHGLPALSFGRVPDKAPSAHSQLPPGPHIFKPAAVCAHSKKPLQAFCVTCKRAICINCIADPARCKSHDFRPLEAIVSGVRDAHAAWVQVLEGRPQQLQAECDRVDAAGEAAHQAIREEVAELKQKLQRACVGDLDGVIREQAQLLADVELAAESPDAAVAGSEASRCLLTAAVRAPRPPPAGAGGARFEAAAADGVRVKRLGRVVEECGGADVSGSSAKSAKAATARSSVDDDDVWRRRATAGVHFDLFD